MSALGFRSASPASAWMDPERWKACADASLRIEQFKGRPCWHGADLGGKLDLLSRCLIFKEARLVGDEEQMHYTFFGYHYAPRATIHDGDHPAYVQWEAAGFLIDGGQNEVNYSRVQRDIERDAELFDMKALAFDPWNATQMQQQLEAKYGEEVVLTVPQTTAMFSDPMKELQAAVYAGRVHHNGDPVLAWAFSNVRVREGNNESVFPRKGPNDKLKIDPVSALLTGFNRAYTAPVPKVSVYERVGFASGGELHIEYDAAWVARRFGYVLPSGSSAFGVSHEMAAQLSRVLSVSCWQIAALPGGVR